jgi:DNA-binding transcriptional ArsR family regulator
MRQRPASGIIRAMTDDLLGHILGEIRERKDASQAAYEESQRLERALAALEVGGDGVGGRDRAAGRGERARVSGGRSRAAPGANRDAILAVVRDRPGLTTAEIASATGIARATVSSTAARLAGGGALERVQLPGVGVGFRLGAAAPETGVT